MKIVVIGFGNSYGGIEIITSDLLHWLVKKEYEVVFVTHNNNFGKQSVYTVLCEDLMDQMIWIDLPEVNRSVLSSEHLFENNVKCIRDGVPDLHQELRIITFYFNDIQLSLRLFKNYNNAYLSMIWPHPLDFVSKLTLRSGGKYINNKIKNKMYYYQQNLLKVFHNNEAFYYGSKSVIDFNSWYYEAGIKQDERIRCLPIREIQAKKIYNYNYNSKRLKVLWVGRFDYFKNDAIICVFDTLRLLKHNYPDWKFIYNIVGYGADCYMHKVHQHVNTCDEVEVHYLGKIHPDELPDIYIENDLGVSMGTTIKQMAMCGLPAVMIDSLNREYQVLKNANWVFDTDGGDAGDGLYYMMMGRPLDYRVSLKDILTEILNNPQKMNKLSECCKLFASQNYSYDKGLQAITNTALHSKLNVELVQPFLYPWYARVLYWIYAKIGRRIRYGC